MKNPIVPPDAPRIGRAATVPTPTLFNAFTMSDAVVPWHRKLVDDVIAAVLCFELAVIAMVQKPCAENDEIMLRARTQLSKTHGKYLKNYKLESVAKYASEVQLDEIANVPTSFTCHHRSCLHSHAQQDEPVIVPFVLHLCKKHPELATDVDFAGVKIAYTFDGRYTCYGLVPETWPSPEEGGPCRETGVVPAVSPLKYHLVSGNLGKVRELLQGGVSTQAEIKYIRDHMDTWRRKIYGENKTLRDNILACAKLILKTARPPKRKPR